MNKEILIGLTGIFLLFLVKSSEAGNIYFIIIIIIIISYILSNIISLCYLINLFIYFQIIF